MENDKKDTEADNRNEEEQSAEQGSKSPIKGGEAEVQAAVKGVKEDGESDIEKIEGEEGCMPEDIEEMRYATGIAAKEAEEAGEQYLEKEGSEEERLDAAEKYVETNYDKIKKTTDAICEKLGIEIDGEEIKAEVIERLTEALKNEELLKTLEEEGVIDEETASSVIFLIPRIEKAIEATKEAEGYEEKAKEVIKSVLDGPEQDPKYIKVAGELLVGLSISGKIPDKRVALAVRIFGLALQNGTVQRIMSNKFRAWLEAEKKEEKSAEEIVEEISVEVGD